MQKKFTKIVATLGPASDSEEMIRSLYENGMSVARLNFSHGSYEYFEDLIQKIRNVSENIAIMLDTKGPEIRTGEVKGELVVLDEGREIFLTSGDILCDENNVCVKYEYLDQLGVGDIVLLDDGLIEIEIIGKKENGIIGKILNSGELGSKKTVTIKGHSVKIDFLSQKDIADIEFGIKQNVDFVAASFVRTPEDIQQLKALLEKQNSDIQIISKIEHPDVVEFIEDIISLSDGIMVARGDLGVEMDLQKLPGIQKQLIKLANNHGKPVIVATQMLESMKKNPRPTRAEVSDVAQAILDGADAVMLSGETASGKYPLKAVQTMSQIAMEYDNTVENNIDIDLCKKSKKNKVSKFISKSVYETTISIGVNMIICPTETGFTARNIAKFRPKCYNLAVARNKTVVRQMALSWGVIPIFLEDYNMKLNKILKKYVLEYYDKGLITKEDRVVMSAGYKLLQAGRTNLMQIHRVETVLDENF